MKKKNLKEDKEIQNDGSREVPVEALPAAFLARMQTLLGDEYEAFLRSYEQPRTQGLRLNPLKAGEAGSAEKQYDAEKTDTAQKRGTADGTDIAQRLTGLFGLRKIPWTRDGYYFDNEARPGRHPYHEAGLYYIQEPSAMAVAELLDPQPGERILDLCAAPGGKTTQIAGRMKGCGLLVSNEIHPARAKILSQNVERIGACNVVVTNEEPSRLADYFPEYFDRILVDAPCSGEGMFRKDETARNEWSPENVILCARRQAEILEQAARMLKAGGRLVYSTCTFSPEENEGTIWEFLKRHGDYAVEKAAAFEAFSPGRPEWICGGTNELRNTFRIWPHKAEGEGHYAAVLKKKEDCVRAEGAKSQDAFLICSNSSGRKKRNGQSGDIGKEIWETWRQFCKETYVSFPIAASEEEMRRRMILFGEQLYLLPEGIGNIDGLKLLRPGLHLGTVKKNRFEPSHALALCSSAQNVVRHYDMFGDSREITAYLRGETVTVSDKLYADEIQNGWTLMTVDGFSIGWGKRVGTMVKNHYPKGLRRDC